MFLCAFSETEYHLSLRNLNCRFESCEAHQVFYAWLVKWYNRTLPTFSQEFDSLTPHQVMEVWPSGLWL